MNIPTIEELMGMDIQEIDKTPVPIGDYNVVITKAEVSSGPKGPYIKVETTVFEGDQEQRKVWRNAVSFSKKAIGMPGGPANFVQAIGPLDIPADTPPEEMPHKIAEAAVGIPVGITVAHETVERNGVQAMLPDGNPEMKATVEMWHEATDEFNAAVEKAAQGLDDDLPF